jgi:hypothetical protein|tara:strand:+ start:152 stop:511 length:360 start_codon:yes stop_codon:yes gene_type:complete
MKIFDHNYIQKMLDKLTAVCYNDTPERETGSDSLTSPLQKDITMTNDFSFNKTQAKIHGLSIQVGELFADLYRSGSASADETEHALEAYKSLRRALPLQPYGSDRHVGSRAAHKATQGA